MEQSGTNCDTPTARFGRTSIHNRQVEQRSKRLQFFLLAQFQWILQFLLIETFGKVNSFKSSTSSRVYFSSKSRKHISSVWVWAKTFCLKQKDSLSFSCRCSFPVLLVVRSHCSRCSLLGVASSRPRCSSFWRPSCQTSSRPPAPLWWWPRMKGW